MGGASVACPGYSSIGSQGCSESLSNAKEDIAEFMSL